MQNNAVFFRSCPELTQHVVPAPRVQADSSTPVAGLPTRPALEAVGPRYTSGDRRLPSLRNSLSQKVAASTHPPQHLWLILCLPRMGTLRGRERRKETQLRLFFNLKVCWAMAASDHTQKRQLWGQERTENGTAQLVSSGITSSRIMWVSSMCSRKN